MSKFALIETNKLLRKIHQVAGEGEESHNNSPQNEVKPADGVTKTFSILKKKESELLKESIHEICKLLLDNDSVKLTGSGSLGVLKKCQSLLKLIDE